MTNEEYLALMNQQYAEQQYERTRPPTEEEIAGAAPPSLNVSPYGGTPQGGQDWSGYGEAPPPPRKTTLEQEVNLPGTSPQSQRYQKGMIGVPAGVVSTGEAAKWESFEDNMDPMNILHGNTARIAAEIAGIQAKREKTQQDLMQLAQLQAQYQTALVQENEAALPGVVKEAGDTANLRDQRMTEGVKGNVEDYVQGNKSVLDRLGGLVDKTSSERSGLTGAYANDQTALNEQDRDSLRDLRQTYDGFGQLGASARFNDVVSNGQDVGHQLDALGQYKDLAQNPNETAAERLLRERGRSEQFRQEKSNRDAVERNLGARGLSSAGSRLAAQRAATAQNSQGRMLSDLGGGAQAVARQMTALQGYAGEANTMRGQSDAVSSFNAAQSASMGQFLDNYKATQQREAAERALNENAAGRQTTAQMGGRQDSVLREGKDTLDKNLSNQGRALEAEANNIAGTKGAWDDYWSQYGKQTEGQYGRTKDVVGTTRQVVGDVSGTSNQGFQAVKEALQGQKADYNADIAAAKASEDEGFIGGLF